MREIGKHGSVKRADRRTNANTLRHVSAPLASIEPRVVRAVESLRHQTRSFLRDRFLPAVRVNAAFSQQLPQASRRPDDQPRGSGVARTWTTTTSWSIPWRAAAYRGSRIAPLLSPPSLSLLLSLPRAPADSRAHDHLKMKTARSRRQFPPGTPSNLPRSCCGFEKKKELAKRNALMPPLNGVYAFTSTRLAWEHTWGKVDAEAPEQAFLRLLLHWFVLLCVGIAISFFPWKFTQRSTAIARSTFRTFSRGSVAITGNKAAEREEILKIKMTMTLSRGTRWFYRYIYRYTCNICRLFPMLPCRVYLCLANLLHLSHPFGFTLSLTSCRICKRYLPRNKMTMHRNLVPRSVICFFLLSFSLSLV